MVKYIEYNDEKLPIRISYTAIKALQEEKNTSIEKVMGGDLEALEILAFHGLKSGHKAEGKEFKMTKEDVVELLEEKFTEFLTIIPAFFPKQVGTREKNLITSLPKVKKK